MEKLARAKQQLAKKTTQKSAIKKQTTDKLPKKDDEIKRKPNKSSILGNIDIDEDEN